MGEIQEIKIWKEANRMKKILTFGTFDVLHEGHKNLFKQMLDLSEDSLLYIIVSTDDNVFKLKKRKTIQTCTQRRSYIRKFFRKLKVLKRVSVIEENFTNPFKHIIEINPDIIVLGYDQHWDNILTKRYLQNNMQLPEIIRAEAHAPSIFKSSLLNDYGKE